MKSVASMPFLPFFNNNKSYYRPEGPEPALVESSEPMSPLEIRRYVRTLRETRRYNYNNEIIFSSLIPDING